MAEKKEVQISSLSPQINEKKLPTQINVTSEDLQGLEDVGFLNAMLLVLLGNYAQTGHFGGPLSYTPANVVTHLGGPENGGLRYDIRHPKHPFTDKFMLAGGHCIPVCYALWMILYESMERQFQATSDPRYKVDPKVAFLSVDALGFRRSPAACAELLAKNGLADDPLFAQAKIRGIRPLMGHSETTDATNDVNGGPSGIGVANSAGKAMFWDFVGAPESLKVIAFEGEFAFTEGHAQELKTLALAQQVGKRLRLFFSYNNAGIDDALIGEDAVIKPRYKDYNIPNQFASYGWNVFEIPDGGNYEQLLGVFKTMETWECGYQKDADRRPMVVIANTIKGWWPGAKKIDEKSKVGEKDQIIGYPSHPYGFAMNSEYFVNLAKTFEERFGVTFVGIRDGAPKTEKDRIIQCKTNVDVLLSVLDQKDGALRKWISGRLLKIADSLNQSTESEFGGISGSKLRLHSETNPFKDARLKVENLSLDPIKISFKHPTSGKDISSTVELFLKPGVKKGTRRAVSEIGKWLNYVTGNRFLTVAADLSHSINLEAVNFTGHYDPISNPAGTRLKAGIQECVNAATVCGLASQTLHPMDENERTDEHVGVWGICGTYGAFTPLMYLPVRIFSQQNQDSPFRLGVVTIVAGHSGPETAADARSHFGIFSPQVWTLFPEGQIINLYFWDYNDVAPGYFAAVNAALTHKRTGVIVIHVARPDVDVVDRSKFADSDIKAAAKGCYLIRDYTPGEPQHGTVLVQGASSTTNVVKIIGRLEAEKINVRIVSVISEELFRLQPEEYQEKILPLDQKFNCMVVTTMTKRISPLAGLGPLTREYSLSADFDDKWRSGGSEVDVIKEAHLDEESIFAGIARFAHDREKRLERQRAAFKILL